MRPNIVGTRPTRVLPEAKVPAAAHDDPHDHRFGLNPCSGCSRRKRRVICVLFCVVLIVVRSLTQSTLELLPFETQQLLCRLSFKSEKTWIWYMYSSSSMETTGSSSTASHSGISRNVNSTTNEVLIAQYSSIGNYSSLLQVTQPVNQAYARYWGFDYVTLVGTGIAGGTCERFSRYNKITILLEALQQGVHDYLLILDGDALIVNFTVNVASLLPPQYMLAALRVIKEKSRHTWHINNGVTLWNLRHNMTATVANRWREKSISHIKSFEDRGDQEILYRTLQELDEEQLEQAMYTLLEEFQYSAGTVVKHFIRTKQGFFGTQGRFEILQQESKKVCRRYFPACQGLIINDTSM